MKINSGNISKKCFFASDVHLGLHQNREEQHKADKLFISWLDFVEQQQGVLFLLGDIFDFWFEYKNTIPNGYGKVLSKLTSMVDNGVEIHFFKGNHDMWTRGFLEQEVGLIIHDEPEMFVIQNKRVVMGHGHNLNINNTFSYSFMQWVFTNKVIKSIVMILMHPDLMMWFGRKWSRGSRDSKSVSHKFRYEDEAVVKYCNNVCDSGLNIDYFIFGHIHSRNTYTLPLYSPSTLFTLSYWDNTPQYLTIENGEVEFYPCSTVKR